MPTQTCTQAAEIVSKHTVSVIHLGLKVSEKHVPPIVYVLLHCYTTRTPPLYNFCVGSLNLPFGPKP